MLITHCILCRNLVFWRKYCMIEQRLNTFSARKTHVFRKERCMFRGMLFRKGSIVLLCPLPLSTFPLFGRICTYAIICVCIYRYICAYMFFFFFWRHSEKVGLAGWHIHTYIPTYLWRTYIHTYTHTHIHTHTPTHIHTYTHTHIHTYTHTHIDTHT